MHFFVLHPPLFRLQLYRPNSIDIEVKSYWRLFIDEVCESSVINNDFVNQLASALVDCTQSIITCVVIFLWLTKFAGILQPVLSVVCCYALLNMSGICCATAAKVGWYSVWWVENWRSHDHLSRHKENGLLMFKALGKMSLLAVWIVTIMLWLWKIISQKVSRNTQIVWRA